MELFAFSDHLSIEIVYNHFLRNAELLMLLAHARNWLKKREALLFNEFHDINKLSIKSKSQKEKKVMLLFDRWNPIHAMDNMLHILMQMAFCQMLLCSITQRATWYAAQCSNENSVKLSGQSFSLMVVSYFCSAFLSPKKYTHMKCVLFIRINRSKHIGNVFHFNILHRHKPDSRRISKIFANDRQTKSNNTTKSNRKIEF